MSAVALKSPLSSEYVVVARGRFKALVHNLRFYFFTVCKYFLCVYRLFSILLMLTYLLLGALVFSYIEKSDPKETKFWLNSTRQAFIERFRRNAGLLKSQLGAISDQVETIFFEYDIALLGIDTYELYDDYSGPWSFGESFSFCFIVVTTIGSGSRVPTTVFGRVLTIVYAVFGIPLCLNTYFRMAGLMFQVLNKIYRYLKENFKTWQTGNNTSALSKQDEMMFGVSFFASLLYLLCGAFVISYGNGKPFLNSFYFMFSTLATIGFGGEKIEQSIKMYIFIPYFCAGYTLLVMVATSGKAITRRIIATLVKQFYRYSVKRQQKKQARLAIFRARDGRFDLADKREIHKKERLKKRRERHKDYLKNKPIVF